MMTSDQDSIVVIGGGAAGMMAALSAAWEGARVTLLERNAKVGRKLYITGKGRCNVTNHCAAEEVLRNTPRNGKFLYSSMNAFPPEKTEQFFRQLGVPLKVERGNRVFPVSDKAADIIDALFVQLQREGICLRQARATHIRTQGGAVTGVETEQGLFPCKVVILATGGVSYPLTGSTGDGYRMAEELGHTIVPPAPSLVPLESEDPACQRMQGLALKNVRVKVKTAAGKTVFDDQGELLFTHFGLSGPLILSASAHMRAFATEHYTVWIDLKPALEEKKLDARLIRDLEAQPNAQFGTILSGLVPRSMIGVLVERCGIPADTRAHALRKEQRRTLLEQLKQFTIPISGPRPIAEAIVTSGGIKTAEINPKTMASRQAEGLFLAGELIDVDAYTGGFNLQIAWATGWAAGRGAAAFLRGQAGKEG